MPGSSLAPKSRRRRGEDHDMKPMAEGAGRIWTVAGLITVAGVLLVIGLVRVPSVPPALPKPGQTPAKVELAQLGKAGDKLLREQADLYDPTPLFLPTEWNARSYALPIDAIRGPSAAFQAYAAVPQFAEDSVGLSFPSTIAVPTKPIEALVIGATELPFAGMGRSDPTWAPPPLRTAYLEAVAAGTGLSVMQLPLHDKDARLPAETDWWPLEFLVTVDRSGLVGLPKLTASSRVEQVDLHFGKYLVEGLWLGGRLEPGFYRIKIGP